MQEHDGALVQGAATTPTPLEKEALREPTQQTTNSMVPAKRRRGMESYQPRGMVMPPRLRIGQPMSNGITEGMFLNEATGEEIEQLQVVFLTERPSRVLFDDDGNWLCRSNDGNFPAATTDGVISETCVACQYAKWGDDGTPPQCKEYWNFLAIDLASMKPLMLQVHGVSMRPADAFMQNILLWDVDLFTVKVTLSLELQEKKNRRYYQLRFSDPKQMPEDEAAPFEDMYVDLVERGGIMAAAVDASATNTATSVDEEVPF